jgi:hypothetical protein
MSQITDLNWSLNVKLTRAQIHAASVVYKFVDNIREFLSEEDMKEFWGLLHELNRIKLIEDDFIEHMSEFDQKDNNEDKRCLQ